MTSPADRAVRIVEGYRPGALGRVVQMHGEYYAEAWGFGLFFESKVARELGAFLDGFDPARDGLWLALLGERIEGSVAIQGQETPAHLRWFITSEAIRGTGAGNALVAAAMRFCGERRFPRVDLWTFGGLDAARHLYEKQGFRLAEERRGTQWGPPVMEQHFEWRLTSPGNS